MAASLSLTRPEPPAGEPAPAKKRRTDFVHSVLSFTRLEVPEAVVYETAVMFDPATDPLTAHDALAEVFGQKAGLGHFLFRADSTVAGRYWVRSVEPWPRRPTIATSSLEPRRYVIQLAEGLMYRFSLTVCAGVESTDGGTKRVTPYERPEQVAAWFRGNADYFGIRPLMLDAGIHHLRFAHGDKRFKIPYATLDGALEVANADRLRRRFVKGFGSYRRAGLGMMMMSS
jgi:hypothetical protein